MNLLGATNYVELFIITVLLIVVDCRKYDVNSESFKLFGEDLHTVVAKFRKTPEYLRILEDSLIALKSHVLDVSDQTIIHYMGQLSKKVAETVGYNESAQLGNSYQIKRRMYRKNNNESIEEEEPLASVLDGYKIFKSPLSVAERNAFRDLGFEYAGNVLHSLIKSMGAEDSVRSTRLPQTDDKGKTTEHALVHEVTAETSQSTATTSSPGSQPSTNLGIYRYKGPNAG